MKNCEKQAFTIIDIRELNQQPFIKLTPKHYPIKHTAYIYRSDESKVKYDSTYDRRLYIPDEISEHIANIALSPVKSAVSKLKSLGKTASPINTLYTAVSDASNVMNIMSLTTSNSSDKYICEHHVDDDINAFITDDFIYIL